MGHVREDREVRWASRRALALVLGWSAVVAIWLYRLVVRPFLGRACLFRETCSHVVERHLRQGDLRVAWQTLIRRWGVCRASYAVGIGTTGAIVVTLADGSTVGEAEIAPALVEVVATGRSAMEATRVSRALSELQR
jgi:putative component of membrane protein insertase Oxa1/YidC/SpoIIIJ protein YidD